MNLLDENVLASQRQLLKQWRVPFRQIGCEVQHKGMTDENIIPFLLTLRRATFFSRDAGFFDRRLCHRRYALVHLDVNDREAAVFIRRLLAQPRFDTQAARMGAVIRVSHAGIDCWRLAAQDQEHHPWTPV